MKDCYDRLVEQEEDVINRIKSEDESVRSTVLLYCAVCDCRLTNNDKVCGVYFCPNCKAECTV
jgi:hypothetical protein